MIIDIMNQPNDLTYRMLEPAPTIYPDLLVKPRIELITESNTTLNISYPLNPPSEILEQNFTINLTFCVNSLFDFYSSNNPDSLKYDTNGNLISGFGFTYDYNEANQLARVKAGSTVIAEYIYDYTGQRFRKNSGGTTTYYLSKDFETKVNSSGTFNTAYYYANGELLARKDPNGQRYYYHNDHLTGTNVVTDSSGNLAERTRYKPFGGIIEGGLSRNLFTGQEWDKDTGQYYYGARYYNPNLMRFVQADPIIQNFYEPQSLNRYSYTLNNPVKYTDPSGNSPLLPLAGGSYLIGSGWGALEYAYTKWSTGQSIDLNSQEARQLSMERGTEFAVTAVAFEVAGVNALIGRGIGAVAGKAKSVLGLGEGAVGRGTSGLVRGSLPRLSGEVAESFGGTTVAKTLKPGETIYRVEAKNPEEIGRWFGTIEPKSLTEANKLYKLPSSNPAEVVHGYQITQEVTVYYGKVKGGEGMQILIPTDVDASQILKQISENPLK